MSSPPPRLPHIFTEGNSQRLRGQGKIEIQAATLLAKVQGVALGSILSSEYSGDFRVSSSGPQLSIGLFFLGRICLPTPKPHFWSPDEDCIFLYQEVRRTGRV